MTNNIQEKVCYMGGHILNQAMVDYREKQHKQVEGIVGVTPYSPHQDKSINDKSKAEQEGLAERILNNDFKAMQDSDIYVLDILNEGLGTISELSILMGIKHEAETLLNYELSPELLNHVEDILRKPVLIYCSDIRQGHNKPYNDPDRAEFSTNQFIYGVILELTDGRGFMSWEEVLEELEKLGGGI